MLNLMSECYIVTESLRLEGTSEDLLVQHISSKQDQLEHMP